MLGRVSIIVFLSQEKKKDITLGGGGSSHANKVDNKRSVGLKTLFFPSNGRKKFEIATGCC